MPRSVSMKWFDMISNVRCCRDAFSLAVWPMMTMYRMMNGNATNMMSPDTQSSANEAASRMAGMRAMPVTLGRMSLKYVSTWSAPSSTAAVTLPVPWSCTSRAFVVNIFSSSERRSAFACS